LSEHIDHIPSLEMITTIKKLLTRKCKIRVFFIISFIVIIGADSLPNLNSIHTNSPSKSSSSSDSSNILSAAVLHKRRPPKRVRFALKLDSIEESSLPSNREISNSLVLKPNRRVIDPWRQDGPLYGAYVEYLEKQNASTSTDFSIRQIPPPPPPPPPEPGAEPPTYTHTFVIQSKSPEIVIDSITVSTPPLHLPRIIHHTRKTNKHQSPTLDTYVKQQLTLSNSPPRIIDTKKLTNSSNQKPHYASVNAAIKRAELNFPSINGLHSNNKVTRTDNNTYGSKFINDHIQPKKMTEMITRPSPVMNNQINHFSDRSILPNYLKKSRIHTRTPTNDGLNTNTPYFYQNNDNDHLLQPIIHSTR